MCLYYLYKIYMEKKKKIYIYIYNLIQFYFFIFSSMKRPRCGVPDHFEESTEGGTRRKRYALTGHKWDQDKLTYRWIKPEEQIQFTLFKLMIIKLMIKKNLYFLPKYSEPLTQSGPGADLRGYS